MAVIGPTVLNPLATYIFPQGARAAMAPNPEIPGPSLLQAFNSQLAGDATGGNIQANLRATTPNATVQLHSISVRDEADVMGSDAGLRALVTLKTGRQLEWFMQLTLQLGGQRTALYDGSHALFHTVWQEIERFDISVTAPNVNTAIFNVSAFFLVYDYARGT